MRFAKDAPIQGIETSKLIVPESNISYSHSISAPVGTTPESISVPVIFSIPINLLSAIGDWILPSHSLILMESFVPALSVCPALTVRVPFLGRASPSSTKNISSGTPPSLSITSTPIECDAGIAPIVARVFVITIVLFPIGCSRPNSSITLTVNAFSPFLFNGSETIMLFFKAAEPELQPVSELVNSIVYPFKSLPRTHIIFAESLGVLAVYLNERSISVLITSFAAFLL